MARLRDKSGKLSIGGWLHFLVLLGRHEAQTDYRIILQVHVYAFRALVKYQRVIEKVRNLL
jgi:hypothetical protein